MAIIVTRRQAIQLALSILLTTLLLAFLWRFIDGEQLKAILKQAHLGWWLMACALLTLMQYWRARRLNVLLDNRKGLFGLMCAQGVANRLLPAWAGEAVLVWLLKRWHQIAMTRSTVSVIAARVLDVGLIILFALIAVIVWPERVPDVVAHVVAIACVGFVGALVGVMLIWRWLMVRASTVEDKNTLVGRACQTLAHIHTEFAALIQRGRLGGLIAWSGLIWITVLIYFGCIATSLGAGLGPGDIVWLHVIVAPVRLLPIKGFANLGTHEASWLFALSALGIEATQATAIAFGSHILMLACAAVLALIAFVSIVSSSGNSD